MAYGNWDNIIRNYRESILHPRIGEHSRAMLNLIPKLRENATFDQIVPGTSHDILFLSAPPKRYHIYVLYSDRAYKVWLCNLVENKNMNEIVVNEGQIVQTIEKYVSNLIDNC